MGWNHNISTRHASWDTLGWYWKWQSLTFDLQDYFGQFYLELQEIWLDHAITCNIFELESPNLHPKCILEFSKLVLKMWVVIDQNLHGHFAISTQNSKKPHSTLLLCTDLGQARGVCRWYVSNHLANVIIMLKMLSTHLPRIDKCK